MHRAGRRRWPPSRSPLQLRLSPVSPGALRSRRRRRRGRSWRTLYGVRSSIGSRMSSRFKAFPTLEDEQALAADPEVHAALSASAGTGKTQVLTARVLRLLLQRRPEVDPSSILCLTFTKAGAAEMAERIHGRLARWVRAKEDWLKVDLNALGEGMDEATLHRARTLFARVLDATGGGLRIQTIHAFAQSLL